MSESEVLIPFAEVLARYVDTKGEPLKRNALMQRVESVGIAPTKLGRAVYFKPEDVELLDQLSDHLKWGGTIKNFPKSGFSGDKSMPVESSELSTAPSSSLSAPSDAMQMMMVIAETFAEVTRPDAAQSLVNRLEALDKAVISSWLLPSSDLAMLLGIARINYGPQFSRYGFTFICQGKQGTEYLWKVTKA